MNIYIQMFEERLRNIFQVKAAEFTKYAEEQPSTAQVTAQLAGLYEDLVKAFNH